MTAPAWSAYNLKGQSKMADSQNDDMMTRRAGLSPRYTGSKPNQFLPVPFAQKEDAQESAKSTPMNDERSESYPVPL